MFSALILSITVLLALSTAVKLPQQQLDANHQAHAKPGGPYYVVDWNTDEKETMTLDASESHTHYFDYGPPPVSGTIIRYQWYSMISGSLLLDTDKPFFTADFFIGITVLKLVVTDSDGDSAEDYTYVSVRRPEPDENENPTVSKISPNVGPVYGGTVVSVYGHGFYNNPFVIFGDQDIKPEIITDTELRFRTPVVDWPRTSRIYVTNGFGTSTQFIEFKYVYAKGNAVKFRQETLRWPSGKELIIPEITSIKLGPDAQYYCGSLNGYVHVLRIDRNLIVQNSCISDNAGPDRSILGIAFNPNEFDPIKVYLTTSTLNWPTKGSGVNWDNGKVEVWGRRDASSCKLSSADIIVSGLPVSADDHAVNGLVFLADGTLLVAVGGSTNAGVHSTDGEMTEVPESPLSGAILAFPMLNLSFDGHITYSDYHDPAIATVRKGSVELYAVGLRNVFGITVHSNQKVYALDNGPNSGHGVEAIGCFTPGGPVGFPDKLLRIRQDAFYGHPNWNRARFDRRQCKYVPGDRPSDEPEYSAPMAILSSSTSGIVEYTANRFGGQLRGRLILSKLSWAGTGILRSAKLDESGTRLDEAPEVLFEDSGLAVELGTYGELLMPKIKQRKIMVLVPDEEFEEGLNVVNVVPRRGPKLGGNRVLVTGSGFVDGVRIFFGEYECTGYGKVAEDGSSVECDAPVYTYGERVVSVVAKYQNLESKPSGVGEYEYMEH